MSRNAIAAMAVIFVSGFAGCAATARASEALAAPTTSISAPATTTYVAPLQMTDRAPAPVTAPATSTRMHRTR